MINVEKLLEIVGADFYTGVPDSQLREICDYLMDLYGIDPLHHVIAANEGNCTALAAGYHLATGKIPVVYMQTAERGISLIRRHRCCMKKYMEFPWFLSSDGGENRVSMMNPSIFFRVRLRCNCCRTWK